QIEAISIVGSRCAGIDNDRVSNKSFSFIDSSHRIAYEYFMRQLGKIHCREINKDDNAPWVVCFHGYGADCNDLFSLGEMIRTQRTYNWLFPNGHLEVPIGPCWTGRAWWNIDMMEVQ